MEDLETADDPALISHFFNQIQEKTWQLKKVAALVGLRINKDVTKIMEVKKRSRQTMTLATGPTDEMEDFTYMRSEVSIV